MEGAMNTGNAEAVDVLPMLRYDVGAMVVPGDRLGRQNAVAKTAHTSGKRKIQLQAGVGTYSRNGDLYASVTGQLVCKGGNGTMSDAASAVTAVVSVLPNKSGSFRAMNQVLRQGQTVLAKVIRIATQQVVLDIVANPHGLLDHSAEGCIRRDDVRSGVAASAGQASTAATATTSLFISSFRPGDWIVARVLSLGDSRRYFLSTAEPSLGVIYAVCAQSGRPMIPVSWKEMECPETGVKELRKCARPPPSLQTNPHEEEDGPIDMALHESGVGSEPMEEDS
jgi:exosome complex component CSL4